MKKRSIGRAVFALAGVLVACTGDNITKEGALETAKKIQTKHNETSFAYPQDKLTVTESTIINNSGVSAEYRIIKDRFFYCGATLMTGATSDTPAHSTWVAAYLYTQGDQYFTVKDQGTDQSYSELTAAEFATAWATALNGDGTATNLGAYKIIDAAAEIAYSILSVFIEENDPSSSGSKASSSQISSNKEEAKTAFSYTSTGDGNLTLSGTTAVSNSTEKLNGQEQVIFNDYYPESVTSNQKGVLISSSESSDDNISIEAHFHWSSCDPIYPDLSKFTKK